ncbi:MAG: putative nitrogen fixation protein NifT [Synechococcaceae cyanobacterium SM2_3_1]|nr:putative nitrogen fixation protein NifT [Synechococcaceae cyanobacterium SM2_3_1]
MKVMLRRAANGHLLAYVAKKDLEEEVVAEQVEDQNTIFTLANGWKLAVFDLTHPLQLPQTVEAKRLSD